MLSNLTGWHFVVILFIVLLLFGAPKLPALARSVGQSMKIFKSEIRSEPVNAEPAAEPAAPAAPAAPTMSSASASASPTAPVSSSAPTASADSPDTKPAP